ncbi:XkdF-like putative serine protease domain-containing protein [Hymenobacter fodinae]|uniref:XkdF-like putative serine protease domain-containing protein n=1 Tax=Hymenobacter fodinae TaxID=2510796 RepID=UPI001436842A|nr:XkdF-like putative serine protease domain-containing protein [Hymenobacter fodinae]
MSKKLKRVAVTLDESDASKGYQRVSLVSKPAIQSGWVALSAAPVQSAKRVHLSAEPQKQLLTGPVLIPDQDILRLDAEGKPYNIFFSAEQIEKIGAKLMLEGRTTETNDQHADELTGNTVRELWIVADPNDDKAHSLGLDVPAGTLMMTLHVADSDYWEKEIVTGNRTGFSIEGLFDFEEVKLAATSAKTNLMKKSFLKIMLAAARVMKLQLAQVELEDGRVFDVAEDGTVKEVGDDGELGDAVADGDYQVKGGGTLSVEGGKKKAADPDPNVENADEQKAPAAKTDDTKTEEPKAEAVTAAQEALAGVLDETDAAKLTAQLKKALTALGVTELAAQEVKLEAITMADDRIFNLNPITRLLTDEAGQYIPTGVYACKDGSYFKVNLDQYTYSIDKETYDRSLKLEAVELELAEAREQLSSESSTGKLNLSSDVVELTAEQKASRPLALSLIDELRARKS